MARIDASLVVTLEVWDGVVGSWVSLGEFDSLEAASDRVADIEADPYCEHGARYRVVEVQTITTSIELERE